MGHGTRRHVHWPGGPEPGVERARPPGPSAKPGAAKGGVEGSVAPALADPEGAPRAVEGAPAASSRGQPEAQPPAGVAATGHLPAWWHGARYHLRAVQALGRVRRACWDALS